MKSKLELEIDICFKERELLSLQKQIETYQRTIQKLGVEYDQVQQELKELYDSRADITEKV